MSFSAVGLCRQLKLIPVLSKFCSPAGYFEEVLECDVNVITLLCFAVVAVVFMMVLPHVVSIAPRTMGITPVYKEKMSHAIT